MPRQRRRGAGRTPGFPTWRQIVSRSVRVLEDRTWWVQKANEPRTRTQFESEEAARTYLRSLGPVVILEVNARKQRIIYAT